MSVEPRHDRSNQAIYLAAVDIADAAERSAFLDKVCGEDAQQRRIIERLLAVGEPADNSPLDRAMNQLVPGHEINHSVGTQAADTNDSIEFDISEHPTIDRYKLLEQIGEGGMGAVYMAQQTEPIRRRVALKLIKAGLDSREVISRFQAERQALALMDHPNIARVLDAGMTAEGRPYFVMELVRGVPITDYCDQNCLSINDRLRLFIDVCRAVQHAHQKGIIHRDLKPSNVMITLHDGMPVVKVIDFGVAKALNQELTEQTLFTQFSQMIGTPLYMSPEQAEMSGLDIDTRSDVYSLGVLLYELLTGTTPFDRDTLFKAGFDGMRRIIREQQPARPSHKVSTLEAHLLSTVSSCRNADAQQLALSMKRELDWIAMKALEKDRNRRYESASAMAADVKRYLDDDPVQACPPSVSYRMGKFSSRYRGVLATAIIVISALLIGSTGAIWQALRAMEAEGEVRKESEKAKENERVALQNKEQAVTQRNAAMTNLYYAEIVSGQTDQQRGYMQRLNQKLLRHLPLDNQPDRRGWEWYYLLSLCHQEFRTLYSWAPNASWSPDGELIAAGGSVWEAASGRAIKRLNPSNVLLKRGEWSPDGQRYAWGMAADDSCIYIWDRRSDELKALRGHTSSVWCLDWHPDSTRLASGGMDGTIRIWEVATRSTVNLFPAEKMSDGDGIAMITDLAWSPDGNLLVAGTRENDVKVWDSVTGNLLEHLKTLREETESYSVLLDWRADGNQLAVCTPHAWFLLDPTDWSILVRQAIERRGGHALAWSPDGQRLAVTEAEALYVWNLSTQQIEQTIQGHSRRVTSVGWSPDGKKLISADGREVKIWDLSSELMPDVIATGAAMQSLQWLPAGRTLVAIDKSEGSTSSWDAKSGDRVGLKPAVAEGVSLWSPDRRLVAVLAPEIGQDVNILNAADGVIHAVYRPDPEDHVSAVAWSHEGTLLALQINHESFTKVVFWDVDRESVISTWKQHGTYSKMKRKFASSPAGDVMVITGLGELGDDGTPAWHGHVYLVDTNKGVTLLKHNVGGLAHRADVTSLAWDPSGKALVAGSGGGVIEALDVASGQIRFSTRLSSTRVNGLAWSPDGRRIVSAAADGSVKVLTAEGGDDLVTFDLGDEATEVQWSPDGHCLAALAATGGVHLWDASRGHEFSEGGSRRGELVRAAYESAKANTLQDRLRQVLSLAPDTMEFWELRGHASARLNDFERAAEEFAKAIAPGLERSLSASQYYGYALLGAGRFRDYQQHCASLLAAFSDTDVPSNGGKVAWQCALMANGQIDPAIILRLAGPDSATSRRLEPAAALYRNGRYAEAADILKDVTSKLERSGDRSADSELASALYFLAMARHRLGHAFQSQRNLASAEQIKAESSASFSWSNRVQVEILSAEARDLIGR